MTSATTWTLGRVLVLGLAASGGVHAALVSLHAAEGASVQAAFAASSLALFASALHVESSGGRASLVASALVVATLIGAYAATRLTAVWPFDHAEPVDALGVLTKLLEAACLVLALRLRRTQAGVWPARPKELAHE